MRLNEKKKASRRGHQRSRHIHTRHVIRFVDFGGRHEQGRRRKERVWVKESLYPLIGYLSLPLPWVRRPVFAEPAKKKRRACSASLPKMYAEWEAADIAGDLQELTLHSVVKIADLHAHNAWQCEELWTCGSAIFTISAINIWQFGFGLKSP